MQLVDLPKLISLMNLFKTKYGYTEVVTPSSEFPDAIYYKENEEFSLIRLTTSETAINEEENKKLIDKINQLIKNKKINDNYNFLDIHIANRNVLGTETFNTIFIYDNHYDGIDVSNYFPDLNSNFFETNENYKKLTKKRTKLDLIKTRPITMTIIIVCFIVYFVSLYLSTKYSKSTSLILLGSDYKMFTVGLNQYFRLLTMAFNHGSIIHLICNMYSLFVLGGFIENTYGKFKYIIVLFYCILIGSITNGILMTNSLSLGISGGLYGLMFIYFKELFSLGYIDLKDSLSMILINVSINFMANTAWQAHLGGFMGGLIAYYCINDNKHVNYSAHVLALILLVALFYKLISVQVISPVYGGTDYEIIQAIKDFGFVDYSNNLSKRLIDAYIKFGGK